MCGFSASSFQKYKYLCGLNVSVQKGKLKPRRRRGRNKKYEFSYFKILQTVFYFYLNNHQSAEWQSKNPLCTPMHIGSADNHCFG
jgi:hypothetical protein